MCTIIIMRGVCDAYPLLVAANRDEFYARAATAPQVLRAEPRAVGGRDLVQGGSWLGATEAGLFVGLTNQRTHLPADPALQSRGEVVVEALGCGTMERLRSYVESLDGRRYNPFNLIYGDAHVVEVAYARSTAASLEIEPVGEGITVLTNDRLGSPHFPKVARAVELAAAAGGGSWEQLRGALGRVLADHQLPDEAQIPEPPPGSVFDKPLLRQLQALCIHTPTYGTCSATVMAIEPGRVARYAFAEGAPCRAPLRDVTALLQPGIFSL